MDRVRETASNTLAPSTAKPVREAGSLCPKPNRGGLVGSDEGHGPEINERRSIPIVAEWEWVQQA
jgi:hypothetical protein